MMRICVLYDIETHGFSPAEFLKHYPCEWEMVTLRDNIRERIKQLADEEKYDIYFNLCDGTETEEYPGIDVVEPHDANDYGNIRVLIRPGRITDVWLNDSDRPQFTRRTRSALARDVYGDVVGYRD